VPGSATVALICATPPITASLPRTGISRSLASIPFCSGMTAVVGPTSGRQKKLKVFDLIWENLFEDVPKNGHRTY
jgi:hypothetical protein